LIAAQWAELFARIAPELHQRIAEDRAQGRRRDQRVRIGFYSYAAEQADGAAPVVPPEGALESADDAG